MQLTIAKIAKFAKVFATATILALSMGHTSASVHTNKPANSTQVVRVAEIAPKLQDKPGKSYVVKNVRYHPKSRKQAISHRERGLATWYCCYRPGALTASGAKYNKNILAAAHKTLPFGSLVKVTNQRNGKSVVVEITDRGPFAKGRIIDLTPAAFARIDAKSAGIANVKIDVLGFRH